ncbi:DUF1684 domain-containing protein [uncultured Winogradskyella sp.]|uniref:DUF1684 domain-containing protein n=1 Tax=uncultured Winogradskyella sp. TaxID=395353 RepID=UPI002627621F|nr:DUF1684 domain-containing protein [uncultured Winogradskyella sp.]
MKNLFLLFLICTTLSCAQEKQLLKSETEWQKKMNADFKDASKSPLKAKDLKTFEGLDFFKFDSAYVVKAKLKRTPEAKPFKMKTTTARLADYRQYAVITFELKGEIHELNIYQNMGLLNKEGYEDYLFLPFLDDTNGNQSYSGGRYTEARIPEGDTLIIDFNKAYNPYCAYSERYSCPIVPRTNYVSLKIEAGVKAFKKH